MKKTVASIFLFLFLGYLCAFAATMSKISGTVTSNTGEGIANVVVSDGFQCVQTDRKGKYVMTSDLDQVRYVFVVVPSGYEVPMDEYHKFAAYSMVDKSEKKIVRNFSLKPCEGDSDHYIMLYEGDPQQMSPRPHSVASWSWACDRLKEYAGKSTLPVYTTLLGDMVVNEIEVEGKAEAFIRTAAVPGIPTFCLPGNHDHIQNARKVVPDPKDIRNLYKVATECYVKHFGPCNYAVNIGKIHYIFLDNCAWGESESGRFRNGLNEQAFAFLESDLKYVPKDTPLMVSMHCPVTKTYGGLFYDDDPEDKALRYDEMMGLFEGRDVNIWYGHIHFYSTYRYTEEELAKHAPGVKSLESHLVGRVAGGWSCSGEICQCGTPRGVVEMEVNGRDYKWHFRSLDENYPDDFNVYVPGSFTLDNGDTDEALYCNVYLWDATFEVPQLWIDGKCAGSMTKCVYGKYDSTYDPLYKKLYSIWEKNRIEGFREEPIRHKQCNHLFKIVPPEGVKSAEVRFKDRWGNEYSRQVNW